MLDPAGLCAHKCQILIFSPQLSLGSKPINQLLRKHIGLSLPSALPHPATALPPMFTSMKTPSSTKSPTSESHASSLTLLSPSATHLILPSVTTRRLWVYLLFIIITGGLDHVTIISCLGLSNSLLSGPPAAPLAMTVFPTVPTWFQWSLHSFRSFGSFPCPWNQIQAFLLCPSRSLPAFLSRLHAPLPPPQPSWSSYVINFNFSFRRIWWRSLSLPQASVSH